MDTDGELEERLEMDTVTEGTSDDEIVSEDNDGEPRIHTPTLDFAGGKLDAYKLGRIIYSRRSWLQEHGQPIGARRVTVAALYELKSPHTEWLWMFMNTHWPDMREGEVTQEKAEEWYDMAVQERHETLPSTQGSLEDLYAWFTTVQRERRMRFIVSQEIGTAPLLDTGYVV